MIKASLLFILFLSCNAVVNAQKNKSGKTTFFVYDDEWNPCKIDDASYLGCFEKLSDTAYQWKYYHFAGPLIAVETYKDRETTIPHGLFTFYGKDGKIDSSGYTCNGRKDRHWYYYTDSMTIWQTEEYHNGKLTRRRDTTDFRLERERRMAEADTVKKVETEAAFKGGDKAWVKYMQKNIHFPDRAKGLGKSGQIIIVFVVGTDGYTTDIAIQQSVEYSIDEEAIRVIRESPRWEPAYQDGKYVKAFRKQPITIQ